MRMYGGYFDQAIYDKVVKRAAERTIDISHEDVMGIVGTLCAMRDNSSPLEMDMDYWIDDCLRTHIAMQEFNEMLKKGIKIDFADGSSVTLKDK